MRTQEMPGCSLMLHYNPECKIAGPPEAINLQMVRPGSMSTVKPLIIRAWEARGKILDLASYLAVRRRSDCTQLQTGGYHYFVFLPCKEPQV